MPSYFDMRFSIFFIIISGLPVFTKVPQPHAAPVQHITFQVTCQAEGFPRPTVTWSRVGMPLPAGRVVVNQGTLTIKNLTPADSGLYDCVATNIMGTKKTRTNVAVQRHLGLYIHKLVALFTPTYIYHLRYKHPSRDFGYIHVRFSHRLNPGTRTKKERNESGVSSQSIVVVAKYNLGHPD